MIFPNNQDRQVVVFLAAKNLAFSRRLAFGIALLLIGLSLQTITLQFLPGLPFLLIGTLLFLVRGYDNRVDFGKFEPDAQWERVALNKLEQLVEHDRRMARWDRNALDVTNGLGAFVLLLIAVPLVLAAGQMPGPPRILLLDALVLLTPHWLTGTRAVMRQPTLLLKAAILRQLLDEAAPLLTRHAPELLMLLQGPQKIPADVKLKVNLDGQPPEFLGLYGQIVINRVQGKPYPYFYVVLVTKPNVGLRDLGRQFRPSNKLVLEFKTQSDVEVLVLRQQTTKTSGYHTKPATMRQILGEGLQLADQRNSQPSS
jgi:hypothetical protein